MIPAESAHSCLKWLQEKGQICAITALRPGITTKSPRLLSRGEGRLWTHSHPSYYLEVLCRPGCREEGPRWKAAAPSAGDTGRRVRGLQGSYSAQRAWLAWQGGEGHTDSSSYPERARDWHSAEHLSVRGCEGLFEARPKLLERVTGERARIHTGPQPVFVPTCQTGKPSSPGALGSLYIQKVLLWLEYFRYKDTDQFKVNRR